MTSQGTALLTFELTSHAQVLVLAPTREVALQIGDALTALGAQLPAPGLALGTFIGGLPTEEDVRRLRRCAVPHPG